MTADRASHLIHWPKSGAMESTQWVLAAVAAEAGCPLPLDQRLVVCEAVPGAVIEDDRPTSAS